MKNKNQIVRHVFVLIGLAFILLPIYMAFIASTHDVQALLQAPTPILPGTNFFENYSTLLVSGGQITGGVSLFKMLVNSFWMAILIAFGKIFCSILSAYAFVYFDFPLKKLAFMIIFSTLMLPVEVRIVPTFQVVASLGLLNHFSGLTLPLIASATATFLFRQFFLTIPKELVEAAKLDGAGAIKFFIDMVLPLSKTNIAALSIIMFIYGWDQYLWPLVITTKNEMATIVMGIQHLASIADELPQWHFIMAIAICAMLPPLLVIIFMQRLFEKGLFESEK